MSGRLAVNGRSTTNVGIGKNAEERKGERKDVNVRREAEGLWRDFGRNPNPEGRSPKEIRNPMLESARLLTVFWFQLPSASGTERQ